MASKLQAPTPVRNISGDVWTCPGNQPSLAGCAATIQPGATHTCRPAPSAPAIQSPQPQEPVTTPSAPAAPPPTAE